MIDGEELASGKACLPSVVIIKTLRPEDVITTLMAGGPANREQQEAAHFSEGQQVRTINSHPKSHTRLPRYARDRVGVVTKVYGVHVFPDSSSQGLGEAPTWLYQVSFTAHALW